MSNILNYWKLLRGAVAALLFASCALIALRTVSIGAPIPLCQNGARAGADYEGKGLSVTPAEGGIQLRCVFQRLEGKATSEGLWLSSIPANSGKDRFRVMASALGRVASGLSLQDTGRVSIAGQMVRLSRQRLVEEYSVGTEGVRQDFVVTERPEGDGDLRLDLDVAGASVEPEAEGRGAQLRLKGSGRRINYNRLRAADVNGRELPARIEVLPVGIGLDDPASCHEPMLAVMVADAGAAYPIRIDPTFSDSQWMSLGGVAGVGVDSYINAAVVDGSGNLYIGGGFAVVGDINAYSVAKWDGTNWSALGSGVDGYVTALAVSGSNLYAGGHFETAGGNSARNIAKWDGSNWSPVGSGLSGSVDVTSLAVSGDDLYAGASATDGPGGYVTKWDGTNWSAVYLEGSPFPYGRVDALAVLGGDLFAGGLFVLLGDSAINYIAKWNGTNWSALGSGVNGAVFRLAVSGNNLLAGGDFTIAGGAAASHIAQWDGNRWSALGAGVDTDVGALAVSGTDIFAGYSACMMPDEGGFARIARWNGTNWSDLGSGIGFSSSALCALAISGTNLYAGGAVPGAGFIVKWDGTHWPALGPGLNGAVAALTVSENTLYAGGYFTAAGDVAANYISQWNGTAWSALGSGMDGAVRALAASGSNLFAGGDFTVAGDITVNYVAKWDGINWSALGSGVGHSGQLGAYPAVSSLTVAGNNLYVGGSFTHAGGIAAANIAQWNGTRWSGLGSGINGPLLALAAAGKYLYVGGHFTMADGIAATNVAQWNGTQWSPLGPGIGGQSPIDSFVSALAVSGSNLYVGGTFTVAPDGAARHIAKWNGTSWSPLDSGLYGYVAALAVSGNDLYAGGTFTMLNSSSAIDNLAKWNGIAWSALGSGVNAYVDAVVASDADLYVGGNFTIAGGKISGYAARAMISVAPGRLSNPASSPSDGFRFTFMDASVGAPYRIQSSPSLDAGAWIDFTNFTYSSPAVIAAPPARATNQFFRAVSP